MTKVPSQYRYQKVFWTLSALCFVLGALYVGLMLQTVRNTLARQDAEKEIAALTSDVSKLEFAYLSATASIDSTMAHSLGYVEVTDTLVAKKSSGLSIAFKNEI